MYSYTRFSSPEQANGDSLRRQIEAADKFATDNKMVLDNSLKMIDRGLSGFHGTNRTEGALGAFLKNVEDGLVASGSILLVENIDRLGREPVLTAMETVNRLLKNGITIQTLSPRDTYTMQSVNDGGIWHLIVHIERAHGESKRKSDLAKTNWKQKRKLAEEDGHKLTTRCPAWFELNKNNLNEKGRYNLSKDKLFIPIPAAIKTIQLIFKLKLQGFGKNIIARKLNEGAEWPRKNGWHASYVEKILNNRAVIGEYQPFSKASGKRIALGEPIKNYFPAIVDEGTFHATQKLKSKNKNTGGETGKATNVFRHLVRCGYCGGPMTFIDKGNPPKGGKYLICDNGRRGADVEIDGEIRKCVATGLSYKEFEETVLSNLPKLRPEMVLLKDDEKETKVKALDNVIAGLEGRLTDIERGQNNVVIGMEKTDSEPLRARLKRRFDELENERAVIEPQIEQRKAERDLAKRGKADFEKWKQDLTD
ncbi:MAG: recombinase family protein [Limisphaerales bacterium]